tara:strand:- start:831 stop:1385 length:555 start_codon:yes stop_codon:yes gene_type:complete
MNNLPHKFNVEGFLVVKNLISKTEANKLARDLKKRERLGGKAVTTDIMITHSPSFFETPITLNMQYKLIPKLEKITGFRLFRTYNYARIYKKGAILKMHKDRPACQISVTMDLGGDKWGIYVLDKNEKPVNVKLEPGDAVVYYGTDVWHWRSKFKGDNHYQIFFHYVDADGQYSWAKDDIKQQP